MDQTQNDRQAAKVMGVLCKGSKLVDINCVKMEKASSHTSLLKALSLQSL